jgi:hypothetical protein
LLASRAAGVATAGGTVFVPVPIAIFVPSLVRILASIRLAIGFTNRVEIRQEGSRTAQQGTARFHRAMGVRSHVCLSGTSPAWR